MLQITRRSGSWLRRISYFNRSAMAPFLWTPSSLSGKHSSWQWLVSGIYVAAAAAAVPGLEILSG
jgi:hypothetical protein